MGVVTVTGNAWTNTGGPFPASTRPQLWFKPEKPVIEDSDLAAGVEAQAVMDAAGAFAVPLYAAPGLRYRPVLRWLTNPSEQDPERWSWGQAEWDFTFNPYPNGGRLEELVGVGDIGGPWVIGLEFPPSTFVGWYLNAPGAGYWHGDENDPESSGTGILYRGTGEGLVEVAILRGPRGRNGKDGLSAPDALPADAAVGEYAAAKTSETYAGIAAGFLADDAFMLNDKTVQTRGDSFGLPIDVAAGEVFSAVLADARDMTVVNSNVSASYDRDVAMRGNGAAIDTNPVKILTGGVNPARLNPDGLTRQAEMSALKFAILQACAGSRIDAATETGTWFDVVSPVFSGGAARQSVVTGSKRSWTPAWGDYFAAGFTARDGIASAFASGTWKRGSDTVYASRSTAPPHTYLEANDFANSAQNFVPWTVSFPALSGSETVSLEAPGTGITTADALWKIADVPPIVAVLIPGNTRTGLPLSINPTDLEIFRGDRRQVIAEVTQEFPRLRGRVVPVELMDFGWDPAVHTTADGLHPSPAGHALIAMAVQRCVARAYLFSSLMSTFGIAGPSWPAWG